MEQICFVVAPPTPEKGDGRVTPEIIRAMRYETSLINKRLHFVGCMGVYLACTYGLGLTGALIPPNLISFLVILPAIPCIVVFHLFFGLLAYLILALVLAVGTWFVLGRSRTGAFAFVALIGILNGLLSSRLSWNFGP